MASNFWTFECILFILGVSHLVFIFNIAQFIVYLSVMFPSPCVPIVDAAGLIMLYIINVRGATDIRWSVECQLTISQVNPAVGFSNGHCTESLIWHCLRSVTCNSHTWRRQEFMRKYKNIRIILKIRKLKNKTLNNMSQILSLTLDRNIQQLANERWSDSNKKAALSKQKTPNMVCKKTWQTLTK